MFNFIPYYIFVSKLFHHLELRFRGVWRIPFVRNSIGKKLPKMTHDAFSEKLTQLLGHIDETLFCKEEENAAIIKSADAALRHEFDLLGSGMMKLEPMQWNKDLKSGYEWKQNVYYLKLGRPKGSDIKMPWELSRCHHLLWLSEAYLITGKYEYANAVVNDIVDWIDKNPFFYSVNWKCSMDVAIRAINWLYALNMIKGNQCLTEDFVEKVYRSLYQHGYYIYNHLEKSFPYSNNHYVSDLVGLLYLGLLFRKETKNKWYDFALNEFCLETRIQVLPSGIHYEKSVSYHRLMTELMGYSYYLLKRNREVVPDDIAYRIKTMFEYVANYTKPNGLAPLIEDNDNGRLLPFVERDFREHGYLCEDSLEMRIIAKGLPVLYQSVEPSSRFYNDAGIAILRSQDAYLFVTCSGRDKYSEFDKHEKVGCHMHNDLLSFELSVGGNDIFIDPGAYIYTYDLVKRNEFRSTKKHNTIFIDGEEQNLLNGGAFEVERNSKVEDFNCFVENKNRVCVGSYILKQSGSRHQRRFVLGDNCLRIEDVIQKEGEGHNVDMFFHCDEGVCLEMIDGSMVWIKGEYQFKMSIKGSDDTDLIVKDDTISPSYGVLLPSKTIQATFGFNVESSVTTIIEWKRISE